MDIGQIIQDAATSNGVDPGILAQIAKVESGGDPSASVDGSSAKGLFQFTNPTWKEYGNGGDPLDPAANADAGARLLKNNATGLASAGIEASPANLYLAHFSGLGGAKKVLTADPTTPVASILGNDAVVANPFLQNMTAADLQNWAGRKMGAAAPTQPKPTAGILNQQQPQAQSAQAPGILNGGADTQPSEPMPDIGPALAAARQIGTPQQVAQLTPIRFAMPRGIDRARLMAALVNRKAG